MRCLTEDAKKSTSTPKQNVMKTKFFNYLTRELNDEPMAVWAIGAGTVFLLLIFRGLC